MTNYEEESRYRRQRSSPDSQQPDISAPPGPIRHSARPHVSIPGASPGHQPGGYSPQQPLLPGMSTEANNNELLYTPTRTKASGGPPVLRHASGRNTAQQAEDEGLALIHFILVGIDLFLVVACVFELVQIIRQRLSSATSFNIGNLKQILILFVIYGLSASVSFWLGRYQNNTLAHEEKLHLTDEIIILRSDAAQVEKENADLKRQIGALQSAGAASASAVPPSAVASSAAQLRPIEQIQPPPSVYDNPREPDDLGDLPFHPHEKIFPQSNEQNDLLHGWRIVGASRRGYGHAYEGKYREDDFNIKLFNFNNSRHNTGAEIALVAIADGVSSKELSRRGARSGVLGATNLPQERLQLVKACLGKDTEYERCREEAYYVLTEAVTAARRGLEDCAQRNRVSIEDLQSTLLIFLAAVWDEQRLLVASTQIGDGVLFALQPSRGQTPRQRWEWFQRPQIGGAGNEVKPFMRASAEEWKRYFQCNLLESAASCVMGMTDGTADDIEPPRATTANRDPDPFLLVDDFYQRIILPSFINTQPGDALVKHLGYRKKQSFDDRTVVCVYHH